MMDGEMERIWLATANSELRSEVLALKQENERHLATIVRYMSSVSEMVDLLAEKDAKIERLRAAGDDMATNLERIESIYHPRCAPNIAGPARIDNCACLLALAAWDEACRGQ